MTPNELDQVIAAICMRLGMPARAVKRGYQLDPFTFVQNYLPATLSATTNAQFTVQADSAFAITRTTAVVTSTTDAGVAGLQPHGTGVDAGVQPFLITLTDSGSGRALMDNQVHIDAMFGIGQRPYHWPIPKILDPNSTFTGALQNLSATSRNVRLYFAGYKIFGNVGAFLDLHR